jgi:hypothetical protein
MNRRWNQGERGVQYGKRMSEKTEPGGPWETGVGIESCRELWAAVNLRSWGDQSIWVLKASRRLLPFHLFAFGNFEKYNIINLCLGHGLVASVLLALSPKLSLRLWDTVLYIVGLLEACLTAT